MSEEREESVAVVVTILASPIRMAATAITRAASLSVELSVNKESIKYIFFKLSPRVAAICPRMFSSSVDGERYGHAGDTSSDVPPINTGCPRRNVKYFGRVFLELNYTDITLNTYIQS